MRLQPSTILKKQSGTVLLLSLVMVLVLSISAVAMFNVNSVNQKIILNQINTMEAEELANEVIENLLNSLDEFETAANEQLKGTTHQILDDRYNRDNLEVAVLNIRCTYSHIIKGYSLTASTVPETNYFEFDIEVSSPITGAAVRMTQGVRFNSPAGLCP